MKLKTSHSFDPASVVRALYILVIILFIASCGGSVEMASKEEIPEPSQSEAPAQDEEVIIGSGSLGGAGSGSGLGGGSLGGLGGGGGGQAGNGSDRPVLREQSRPRRPVDDTVYSTFEFVDKRQLSFQMAQYPTIGFVALTDPAGDADQQKLNYAICRAFSTTMYSQVELREIFGEVASIPTNWIVKNIQSYNADKDTANFDRDACDIALEHYDYRFVFNFLSRKHNIAMVETPLLLAVKFDQDSRAIDYTTWSLKGFKKEDIHLAAKEWSEVVTQNPEYWQDGFEAMKKTYVYTNFRKKYGREIIEFFKPIVQDAFAGND